MPQPILIKSSTVAGAAPTSLASVVGGGSEIALNRADGKIFYLNSSGVVTQLATGGGGGGSTSASDLTSGTLADARLSNNAQAAINSIRGYAAAVVLG